MKNAIITGIYGQDGSLLAEYLIAQGYQVTGLVSKLRQDFKGLEAANILALDVTNSVEIAAIFKSIQPDEFYHLAAAHHSSETKTEAEVQAKMLRVNFQSTQVILEELLDHAPDCRFMYAGSSQMYTPKQDVTIIDEDTPYLPNSYYGVTKVASAQLIDLWRRQRGLWGVTLILFNHESARRSNQFLSRKITRFVGSIKDQGAVFPSSEKLSIRDVTARTDWSDASDFVKAFHLSLQADQPTDYVLASGKVHSVEDFLNIAFQSKNLQWQKYIQPEAPNNTIQAPCLQGNSAKAETLLGWTPRKSFQALIYDMVKFDKTF